MPRISNIDLFNGLRLNKNSAFYNRIPEATLDNLSQIATKIVNYKPMYDEMTGEIAGKIGMMIGNDFDEFVNPLAIFHKGQLPYGTTVEEIYMGLLPAKEINREQGETDVFKRVKPDIKTLYHSVNSEEQYKVSIDKIRLRQAVLAEFGFYDYLYELFTRRMWESCNWDDYLKMLRTYEEAVKEGITSGNVTIVTIPDTSGTELGDRKFSSDIAKALRATTRNLGFYSKTTIAGVENLTAVHNQAIVTTPVVEAYVDVDTLAKVVHMEKAEPISRICTVHELEKVTHDGVERDVLAVMSSVNLLQVYDYYKEMEPEVYNPANMTRNVWLNNIGVYSYSKFANMVIFLRGDKPNVETVMVDAFNEDTPEAKAEPEAKAAKTK